MANTNALEHLLKTEAKAVALVNDANEEAQRRICENEEKNRAEYEENKKTEIDKRRIMLENEKIKANEIYNKELDNYRDEISRVVVNKEKFYVLMNKLTEDG
jgi:vacuolar-type H+-ATPase subunit H